MTRHSGVLAWAVLVLMAPIAPLGADAASPPGRNPPPHEVLGEVSSADLDTTGFALVLGGGGARGFAHLGVLRLLEEMDLRPSLIVGTSMGAVMGALYASGHDVDEIEALLERPEWLELMLDVSRSQPPVQGGWTGIPRAQLRLPLTRWPPSPRPGVSYGQALETLLGELTADALFRADSDFDRLPVPFRCVASDVVAARSIVYDHGPLPRVVRASGSLPLVFIPVHYDGRWIVDGGLTENLPLRVAHELGFSRSLVIDVSNIFLEQEGPPEDIFDLFRRTTQLTQLRANRVQPWPGDVLLRPDLREYTTFSFWSASDIIGIGYEHALRHRDRIAALAARRPSPASGPADAEARSAPEPAEPVGEVELAEVEVLGTERLSPWSIRKRLDVEAGDRIALPELWRRAGEIAKQSIFENVWLDVHRLDDGRAHVRVHVVERNSPELELAANHREGIGAGLLMRLRLENRLVPGSAQVLSWRLSDERAALDLLLIQSLRAARGLDVRLEGGWDRERAEIYEEGDEIDAWIFRTWRTSADLVVQLGRSPLALHVGVQAQNTRRRREQDVDVAPTHTRWRALHLGLESSAAGGLGDWPETGFGIHASWGADGAGGEIAGRRLEGGGLFEHRFGRHWQVATRGGFAWMDDEIPVELMARAGGPESWAGLRRDEILARHLAFGRLDLHYFFRDDLRVFGSAAYGWHGQTSWSRTRPRAGGQLALQWDTFAGPVRLGLAGSHRGETYVFFDVGYTF